MTGHIQSRNAGQCLLHHFRSLVVLADFSVEDRLLRPDSTALLRWIEEYHHFFIQANAVVNGPQFHAFSRRVLTLTGHDLLKAGSAVAAIDALAGRLGIATHLTVTMRDIVDARLDELEFLTRLGLSLAVDFSEEEDSVGANSEMLARNVSMLLELGPTVTFVGDMAKLRKAGITDLPTFNNKFISVLSKKPRSGVRLVQRRWERNPCKAYVSLYIDQHGDVYPCAGLVGHAPARFGNIKSHFSTLVLPLEQSNAALERLSITGPTLPASASFPADICSVHRDGVKNIQAL